MGCRSSLAVSAVSSFVPVQVASGTTEMTPPSQTSPCRFSAAGSSSRTLRVRPGMSDLRRQ
jgi:hypothetical protein